MSVKWWANRLNLKIKIKTKSSRFCPTRVQIVTRVIRNWCVLRDYYNLFPRAKGWFLLTPNFQERQNKFPRKTKQPTFNLSLPTQHFSFWRRHGPGFFSFQIIKNIIINYKLLLLIKLIWKTSKWLNLCFHCLQSNLS